MTKNSGFLLSTNWFIQINQSAFIPVDTSMYWLSSKDLQIDLSKKFSIQILSTHKTYKFFGGRFEVTGFFLDISKMFYKVSHKEIFKLKQNGIFDKLFSILFDFLKDKKQRVTINGQASSCLNVNVGFH